jgi:MFS-type transporter involved in bile tolerance (Atg22 family)
VDYEPDDARRSLAAREARQVLRALFSLAGRFSAVLGPALTALLLLDFGGLGATAYRISVGSLSLIMLLRIFFLSRVPDARPERNVDEFVGERRSAVDSPT